MNNTVLKIIFDFLEEKGEQRVPFLWKWKNGIPLIEEDLEVGGDLNLQDSKITSLPNGLVVGGDLILSGCESLYSLPEGLEVGDSLDLIESSVEFLPKGLKVGRDLYIDETPLTKYTDEELREMIKPGFIKGEILR